MTQRDFDRWHNWFSFALWLLWTLAWSVVLWALFGELSRANGATLSCAPMTSEPPAMFMRALELTESDGIPRPGDDGQSHGRYQISVRFAADCMGIPPERLADPQVVAGLIAAASLEANNLEWARRRSSFCLARHGLAHWSQAYWCYNAGEHRDWQPNHPHVLRFASIARRVIAEERKTP